MKKFLLIMCVCAILLAGTSCKSKKTDVPDETGDVTAEDTKPRETIDIDGDGISDGYVVEGISGYDPDEVHTDEAGEGDEGDTPVKNTADDTMPTIVISDGGKEEGLWPSENIPDDVPAYENYEEMYPVQYTDNESSEEWYLSFDSTEKDYEDWIEKLIEEGYQESDKIVGFWGNGEQILNIFTEEIDGEFCVSIDIFKSKPVEYPSEVSGIFPEFTESDSTLYGWYVKPGKDGAPNVLSISYACGYKFEDDLAAYKQKLTDAGFTVTDEFATKEVDGKTYTVRYGDTVSASEDSLEFEY